MAKAVARREDDIARLGTALADSAWLTHLPEAKRTALLSQLVVRKLSAGDIVYEQGAAPEALYGIVSGSIQTIGVSADGHEALLSVLRDGEWTGFLGLLDGRPNPFSTIAGSASEIAILPRKAAEEIFGRDAASLSLISRPLAEILRFAYRFLVETNGRPPKRVIAQRLMDLSRCVYIPGAPLGPVLDQVSQDALAAASYLTRPTVNRILRTLETSGLIRLGYGRIEILDVAGLHAVATEAGRKKAAGQARGCKGGERPSASPSQADIAKARESLSVRGWLPTLPREIRQEMLAAIEVRRYAAGDALYRQDEPGEGMFGVVSGQFRTMGQASDGRVMLLSLVHGGEWTGFVPAIGGGIQPFSVTASGPAVAALLPLEKVDSIFRKSAHRYRLLLAPLLAVQRFIYDFLIEANRGPPHRLVAQRLFDLARLPYVDSQRPRDYVANLTQHDVAIATGLSRPTVHKVLNDLAAKGVIALGYGNIRILDHAGLGESARRAA
jgi:CRP-like cAMP-binding protein